MAWSWFRRRRLKEVVQFAEALAEGDTTTRILETGAGSRARLVSALTKISSLLESRSSSLLKEESHLSGLLATVSEGVLLTDENGDIVLANQSLRDLFQVASSPTGKSLIEVFRQGELQVACDALLARPGRKSLSIALAYPQEKIIQVNFSTLERKGKIQGVVGVFIDVTQMKKLEAMRKDLIANISHEFKTPLSSIKGYSETLSSAAPKDPKKTAEFASIIARNAERLERLVENLMALSRLEQHEEKPQSEKVSLSRLVQEARDQLAHRLEQKNISLENKLQDDLPAVIGDTEKLQQVFLNILENAVKYSPAGSRVAVQAQPAGHFLRVAIQDNGPGISAHDLPRIFERFYRVEKSRSLEGGGSGLGLAIAKHIVQMHGGKIWAESEPGKGMTLFFTLPIEIHP